MVVADRTSRRQAEEYLVLYARDRTETVSQVFLGLTTGCAVCHDHKFDPLSQKEFYELSAFFNNTTQAAMDGNVKDTPPTVFVPDLPDRGRWEALLAELTGVKQQFEDRKKSARPEFDKWLADSKPETFAAFIPVEAQKLRASLAERDSAANKTTAGELELAVADVDQVMTEPNEISEFNLLPAEDHGIFDRLSLRSDDPSPQHLARPQ